MVITTGKSYRPIRATASASRVTALSSCRIEPWPGRPRAISRSQAIPFSAVWIGYIRTPSRSVTLNPPTSLTASVQPSNSSGWLSTRNRAPLTPPASSSATNATTTSRGGCSPVRAHCRTSDSSIASMSFMSIAPRPQMKPSRSSPEKGCTDHSAESAGTTSRWPCSSSAGRDRSVPSIRATTLARPGSDSYRRDATPTSSSLPVTHSAAARSELVGLDVSKRINSEQSSTTSSWALVMSYPYHSGPVGSRRPGPVKWSGTPGPGGGMADALA